MDITMDNRQEHMLTVKQVSRLLNVHPNTLRRWSNDGLIKSYRINQRGDRRFSQSEVNHFLVQFRQNRGSPHIGTL